MSHFAPCGNTVHHHRGFFQQKLATVARPTVRGLVRPKATVLPFICILSWILLNGCRSTHGNSGPAISFTRVPPAAEGGPDKVDIIQGRVTGAQAGQQIVLYAKIGSWWVQPLVNEPFTRLNPDATWTNATHVGTDYAAILVEPGYKPQTTLSELPATGSGVAAVASAKGASSGSSVTQTLFFSGYEWRIRNAPSSRGGQNDYDPSNAWTDADGALHLRIAKTGQKWTCAEVTLTRSLGYGTYAFVVGDTSQLVPSAVFAMFTWDYSGPDPNHREMDIEVSRWANAAVKNAEYIVQPFYLAENASGFMLPSGVFTHSFRWEPGRVVFRTVRGGADDGKARPVAEHAFTSGVPMPGVESVRMAVYLRGAPEDQLQKGTEVVIEKFEYLP